MFSRRLATLKSLRGSQGLVTGRMGSSVRKVQFSKSHVCPKCNMSHKMGGFQMCHREVSMPLVSVSNVAFSARSVTRRTYASLPKGAVFIEMSALSPTMEQGNLVSWVKKEGDRIEPGDALCQVQTDKSTMEMEYQEEGYLAKILVQGGSDNVSLGTPIAIFVEKESDIALVKSWTPDATSGSSASSTPVAPTTTTTTTSTTSSSTSASTSASTSSAPSTSSEGRVKASPYAKKLATEANVSLAGVQGSGPEGRIVAEDVKELVARQASAPSAVASSTKSSAPTPSAVVSDFQDFQDVPVTQIRKVIAERLLESKRSIPHYYLTVEVQVDDLLRVRSTLNKRFEREGVKLSVNDFILKAAALAARDVPAANSSWQGTFIRQYNSVDMSVAVQTDSGLITPIVFDCDKKGLKQISQDVKALAQKARDNKLQPHEFQGGTFTVSNLGMFGIKEFSAIINPPQACILAIGSAQQKVVEVEGSFKTSTTINVTLSCDHRVVDGAVGAQYLQAFTNYLSDPLNMIA